MRPHETQIRVRYEDADPMGLLHHAKYLTYFEIGRTEWFRSRGNEPIVFAVADWFDCLSSGPSPLPACLAGASA